MYHLFSSLRLSFLDKVFFLCILTPHCSICGDEWHEPKILSGPLSLPYADVQDTGLPSSLCATQGKCKHNFQSTGISHTFYLLSRPKILLTIGFSQCPSCQWWQLISQSYLAAASSTNPMPQNAAGAKSQRYTGACFIFFKFLQQLSNLFSNLDIHFLSYMRFQLT